MAPRTLNLALIGCGRFGVYLGEFAQQELDSASLTALVEPDGQRRVSAAQQFHTPAHATIEQLLDHAADTFDAALIVSPNHMHRSQTIALARAGKHVFCEKPMALNSEDCREMVVMAQQHNVRLMVGHKRRLRPAWRRLIELVRHGDLGDLCAVNINGWHYHPDIPAWWLTAEEGGGLLHRAGVHDVDICNALLGDPVWVEATGAPAARPEATFTETLWATIGYESGAVAGIQVSLWFSPVHFRDSFAVQVLGTRGSAMLRNSAEAGQTLTWGPNAATLRQEYFEDGYELAYQAELSSFLDWVCDDKPPLLSWREGWQVVRVMEAAYQAAREYDRVTLEPLAAFPIDGSEH